MKNNAKFGFGILKNIEIDFLIVLIEHFEGNELKESKDPPKWMTLSKISLDGMKIHFQNFQEIIF